MPDPVYMTYTDSTTQKMVQVQLRGFFDAEVPFAMIEQDPEFQRLKEAFRAFAEEVMGT